MLPCVSFMGRDSLLVASEFRALELKKTRALKKSGFGCDPLTSQRMNLIDCVFSSARLLSKGSTHRTIYLKSKKKGLLFFRNFNHRSQRAQRKNKSPLFPVPLSELWQQPEINSRSVPLKAFDRECGTGVQNAQMYIRRQLKYRAGVLFFEFSIQFLEVSIGEWWAKSFTGSPWKLGVDDFTLLGFQVFPLLKAKN